MSEENESTQVNLDEIATIGKDLDIFGGWINHLANPDPVINSEAGGKGIKLYDEIARDSHAGSVLQTRCLAVVGKEWEIIPAESANKKNISSGESIQEKQASFVEKVLEGCNFDQIRLELLQAILYGYYGAEIMWGIGNRSDIIIAKFYGKHPRRFCFTQNREPRLLTPSSMIEGEEIPPRKFLIFRYGDSDNPYGKGLGQKLWFPVWFKKHGIKFWVIFLEKFGMPTTVGKYPSGAKGDRAKLLEAIDAIRTETGITIPEGTALELLEASRSGTATYGEMCEYMDRQISKAVLGQTLTTEIGKTGAYSAAKVHDEVRQDITESDADLLDQYLNNTLVKWTVDYNFPGVTDYPQLKTLAGRKPDLLAQSRIDNANLKGGVKIPSRYFYETYNYPVPEEGEEIVEVSAGPAAPMIPPRPEFAESRFTPEQEAIEGLVDRCLKEGKPIFGALFEPLKELVDKTTSLEELRDALFEEYNHMDTKDLEELLVKAMIVAHLHGRSTGAER